MLIDVGKTFKQSAVRQCRALPRRPSPATRAITRTHAATAVARARTCSRLLCMRVRPGARGRVRVYTHTHTYWHARTHRWFSKYEVDKVDAIVITHEHADAMLVPHASFLFFIFFVTYFQSGRRYAMPIALCLLLVLRYDTCRTRTL